MEDSYPFINSLKVGLISLGEIDQLISTCTDYVRLAHCDGMEVYIGLRLGWPYYKLVNLYY